LDIRGYTDQIPEMDRFLTDDEMHAGFQHVAAKHPDLASVQRVGSSKIGEPIHILTIGSGSRNILLFGCPHPNEPIGSMMLDHLSRLLCTDEALRTAFDATWHLIFAIDPDGARLNEGWFAGPMTPKHYARNFYRPAGHEQVEWTFPNSYKTNYFDRTLPETEALMRVMDDLKPALVVSLHNAGFGGACYYLSRPLPSVYPTFHQESEFYRLLQPGMLMRLLEAKNLTITYRTDCGYVAVVQDVSFSVPRGGSIELVEESDSGKSTIAMAVMRLLPANAKVSGQIIFDGTDLTQVSDRQLDRTWRWRKLSMVFQKSLSALSPVHRIGDQMHDVLRQHDQSLTES
jgi:hypothetical protein